MIECISFLLLLLAGGEAPPSPEAQVAVSSNGRALAPLHLELSGRELDGDLLLTANLEVRSRLAAPLVLDLILPRGASLVEGLAREELGQVQAPATVKRTFRVREVKGECLVKARAVGMASGAVARAYWPERTEARFNRPGIKSVPPFRILGTVINKAIPVRPSGALQK